MIEGVTAGPDRFTFGTDSTGWGRGGDTVVAVVGLCEGSAVFSEAFVPAAPEVREGPEVVDEPVGVPETDDAAGPTAGVLPAVARVTCAS